MEPLIIFITSFVASFIGASVGGAGLILLPVLIFVGLNSKIAVATAAVSHIATAGMGLYKFHKHGKIDYEVAIPITLFLTVGAVLGALLLVEMPAEMIKKAIGIFLILVTLSFFIKPNKGLKRVRVSQLKKQIGNIVMVFVGVYKGALTSGSSLLASYTLIHFYGLTYMQSVATRKLPYLISFIVSAFIYIQADIVDWPTLIILLIANAIGAYTGVHFIIKKGELWVKYGFATVVIISAIKLLIN